MTPRTFVHATSQFLPLPLIFGLLLSGCTTGGGMVDPFEAREQRESAQRKDGSSQPGSAGSRRDLLTPTLNSITSRIHAYEQKLEEWSAVERKSEASPLPREKSEKMFECTQQLEDILAGYRSLHSRLLQETRLDAAQLLAGDSLLQLNQQDVDYLEGGCGRLLTELKTMPAPQPARTTVAADPQIREAFENGEYDRVITLYTQLPLGPGQFPAHETAFQYGQALVKNHQESSALTVFDSLLQRIRQQGQDNLDLQVLRALADLQFGLGAYDPARSRYEELARLSTERGRVDEAALQQFAALQPGSLRAEELRDYSVLLKNYRAYTPKRDGYAIAEQADVFLRTYPESRMLASVEEMRKGSREQADAWLNRGIQRIESMASERKAQEGQIGAVQAGQEIAAGATPAPSPATPGEQSPGQVQGAPQPPAATPISEAEQKVLQEDYDKGMALLAAKEYDKSIEQFAKLLKTSFADKARVQIDEAARLAAQQDRQKAADLFVRANSTRDPESKKKLLLSSKQLLQDILVKYPQSGLADKVQKNLSNVERELKAVEASSNRAGEAGANMGAPTAPALANPALDPPPANAR